MAAQKKYPDELRERAVKMVLEIRERDGKGLGELARVARLARPGLPVKCQTQSRMPTSG
jgi:transposase-like protein